MISLSLPPVGSSIGPSTGDAPESDLHVIAARIASDSVFRASGWRCGYCGQDLLGDEAAFLGRIRDHVRPRSRAGTDSLANRVAACTMCDRLKRGCDVRSLDEARRFVARKREEATVLLHLVRTIVRGGPSLLPDRPAVIPFVPIGGGS